MDVKYKRAFLKLSGEAIAKKDENGAVVEIFDDDVIDSLASTVCECVDLGTGLGIMLGAGNIWRGKYGRGMVRAKADHMGMLATTINCLRMQDAIQKKGRDAVVMTAVEMNSFTEPFSYERAVAFIDEGRPVIFGCGVGMPYVSTDTAGVVRALEIGAEVILMAKNVDGVYTADPSKDPSARRYRKVSYKECLDKELHATDISASAIARENGIDMLVFSLKEEGSIIRAIKGENVGTLVTAEDVEAVLY